MKMMISRKEYCYNCLVVQRKTSRIRGEEDLGKRGVGERGGYRES